MLDKQDNSFTQEVTLRGFARVVVVDRETGLVQQDTGYIKNKITANGFQYMVAYAVMGSTANQSIPTYIGLGSNAAISSSFTNFSTTGTDLGMIASQNKVTSAIAHVRTTDGGIARVVGYWPGGTYVGAGSVASFNAVAMYPASATNASALCAATFAQVTWSSNNDVWLTYDLKFSQV